MHARVIVKINGFDCLLDSHERMPIRKMSTEHVLFAISIARMPVQIDDLCSRMIKNWTEFFSFLSTFSFDQAIFKPMRHYFYFNAMVFI